MSKTDVLREEDDKLDIEQYQRLMRCSEAGDITEWNEWRESNEDATIQLDGAYLNDANLQGADLRDANLQNADLWGVNLQGADLQDANLQNVYLEGANLRGAKLKGADLQGSFLRSADLQDAKLWGANLQDAKLWGTNLRGAHLGNADLQGAYFQDADLRAAKLVMANIRGAKFHYALVDGLTTINPSQIDKETDFAGVALDVPRMTPGLRPLLQWNIRRVCWGNWYKQGPWWKLVLKNLFVRPFWFVSDYGLFTWKIVLIFFALTSVFAVVYWSYPSCLAMNVKIDGETVSSLQSFWHAAYFSLVTMTTLGFGDIHANPHSVFGQSLLMIQVILGYVLLGALITRLAVLFTSEGPAAKHLLHMKRA